MSDGFYSSKKRAKEIKRQKKQEEKRKKRLERKNSPTEAQAPEETPGA